ncbi:MAG: site-2 protease family protein [bacterium]|nr:site-2 protease family protein [bacterium]
MDGSGLSSPPVYRRRRKPRYWLHLLLFALTLVTTTVVGARMAFNFENNLPAFSASDLTGILGTFLDPSQWASGLPFSLTLVGILLAHEFGHFFACVYYRIDASLPYFLPAPTLIGTLGAFIRIRSPIYTRRALFDVGVAGPLAGFAMLLPLLAIGISYSKVIPGIAEQGEIVFGSPAVESVLVAAILPGVNAADIYLHPMARAAWVGVLATALNLLPIGQLDGGHILYSFVGKRRRILSRVFVVALIPLGILGSRQWLLWAAVLFLLGTRHPSIQDPAPLGPGRRKLGLLALGIFILSFSPAPVLLMDGF